MFGHEICLKGRLDTFSRFSAFKIHNSVSLWVKITRKPNGIGRPSWCFARKQSSNSATGCDVINRWIIGTRNKYRALLESWAPPPGLLLAKGNYSNEDNDGNENVIKATALLEKKKQICTCIKLFCTILCRPCTTTTLKCLISRFLEDVNKRLRIFFVLLNLCTVPKKPAWGHSPTFGIFSNLE